MFGSNGVDAKLQVGVIDAEHRKLSRCVGIEDYEAVACCIQQRRRGSDIENQLGGLAKRLTECIFNRRIKRQSVGRASSLRSLEHHDVAVDPALQAGGLGLDAKLRDVERCFVNRIGEVYLPRIERAALAAPSTLVLRYLERSVGSEEELLRRSRCTRSFCRRRTRPYRNIHR